MARHDATREFADYLSSVVGSAHIELSRTERGGAGGSGATWAHWQLTHGLREVPVLPTCSRFRPKLIAWRLGGLGSEVITR